MSRLYFFLNRYVLFLLLISGSTSSGFLEATENKTNRKSYLEEKKKKELKYNILAVSLVFFTYVILVPIMMYYFYTKKKIYIDITSVRFITVFIFLLIILFISSSYNNNLEAKIKELRCNKGPASLGFSFSFLVPILVLMLFKNNEKTSSSLRYYIENIYRFLLSSFITALISCSIILLFRPSYYVKGALVIWIIICISLFKIIERAKLENSKEITNINELILVGVIGVLLQYIIPELIYRKWKNEIVVQ